MAVRKRGKKWICELPNGLRYPNGRPKYSIETFKRETDALVYEARTKDAINRKTYARKQGAPTIGSVADQLLENKRNKIKPRSFDALQNRIRKHIHGRTISQLKITDLTVPVYKRFFNEIADEVSVANAYKMVGVLGQIEKEARENGDIHVGVIELLALAKRPKRKKRVGRDVPTMAEIRRLLASAEDGWFRDMLVLAIFTAMREGELCALQCDEVNFDTNVVTVIASAGPKGDVDETKTPAADREIDMAPIVCSTLERRIYSVDHGSNVTELRSSRRIGFVFLTRLGKPPTPASVLRKWHQLQIATGILGEPGHYTGAYAKEIKSSQGRVLAKAGPVIKEMRALNPTIVPGRIAKELNARGITTQQGRPWRREGVIDLLNWYDGKHAKYNFHSLRHFSSSAHRPYLEHKELQEMMGHANIEESLGTYGHILEKPKGRAAKLAEIEKWVLGGPQPTISNA